MKKQTEKILNWILWGLFQISFSFYKLSIIALTPIIIAIV